MCKHEEKSCPRCQQKFECKVGDVQQCQCFGINFDTEEKAFIEGRYNDCLCRNCLLELKQRSVLFTEKYSLDANK
jgi:Cysteine-rich CWC